MVLICISLMINDVYVSVGHLFVFGEVVQSNQVISCCCY